MERYLAPFQSALHAVLRIVAGFLFFQHGLPKLFGGFGRKEPAELFSQMGLAGVIEVFGGAAIALGLFASPIAFIASGETAVAYFQAHAPRGFWPIANGGELAALVLFRVAVLRRDRCGQVESRRVAQTGSPKSLVACVS